MSPLGLVGSQPKTQTWAASPAAWHGEMALFSEVSYHESSVTSPNIHTILGVTGIEDPLPWQL